MRRFFRLLRYLLPYKWYVTQNIIYDMLGAFLFLVPAVILSGFSTPIDNMPQLVQWLTYLDPLRYFLVIVRGVTLEGNSYALLIHQYWPMARSTLHQEEE